MALQRLVERRRKMAFEGKSKIYSAQPGYPDGVVDYVLSSLPNSFNNAQVADIGAGTGKLSALLAERGAPLIAIEPDPQMREELSRNLNAYSNAKVVAASAENTGLPDKSLDIIACAQAFHWFDANAFRSECDRILKPGGKIFAIYNQPDMEPLEELAWHRANFSGGSSWKGLWKSIEDFFHSNTAPRFFSSSISYSQPAFLSLMLSYAQAPKEGDPNYERYVNSVLSAFARLSNNGIFEQHWTTRVYSGS
jgi:SAM-dependent methyltransferase